MVMIRGQGSNKNTGLTPAVVTQISIRPYSLDVLHQLLGLPSLADVDRIRVCLVASSLGDLFARFRGVPGPREIDVGADKGGEALRG